jgi:type I restriction enzyme S subunit
MKSNYKRIGAYIQEINNRNKDLEVNNLLGVNIDKFFMPSVANIVGTDMTTYKILKKGQFACNRMHVGRDKRLPVALSYYSEDIIISPAYNVFEIKDTKVLLPDYLMMWFSRSEFDRNAWFYTDADVRGGLNWRDFCNMKLPIPTIDKQKEIIKEYNVIADRIKLNNRLIQKLEETAQAIYKQWFVDFEFPDEKGLPYKSNGGEMVESELGEIPMGWKDGRLEDISSQIMGYAFEGENYSFENGISVLRGENVSEKFLRWDTHKKWNNEITKRIEKCYLMENDIVIGMDGSKVGKNWAMVSKYNLPLLLAQRVSCIRAKEYHYQSFIFYSMCVLNFVNYVSQIQTGTSIPHISGEQIFDFPVIIPTKCIIEKFDNAISKSIINKSDIVAEVTKLDNFKTLLLSKLATIEN